MPKKRRNWSVIRKEKQQITARLIEISLKIDEYVYKHRPITETDAKRYIEEVISYKTRCSGDERSLQVIEKLTRCMNAIILEREQKEVRDDICIINDGRSVTNDDNDNVRASSLSPVYSILDEDRTQLTQTAEEHARINTEPIQDVEIIDLSNIDDDDDFIDNITNSGGYSTRLHVEVDIHRGISNLSLREVEEIPNTISSYEHSQSILNNFESIENVGQNNYITSRGVITDGLKGNDADKVIKTTNVLKSNTNIANTNNIKDVWSLTQNNKPVSNISNIQINQTLESTASIAPKLTTIFKNTAAAQATEPKKIWNTTKNVTKAYNHYNDQITATACYQCKDTPESQRKTWYDSDRTCTINNSGPQDITHKQQPGLVYKNDHLISNTFNETINTYTGIPINKTIDVQTARAVYTARSKLNNDKSTNNGDIGNDNSTTTKKKRAPRKKKGLGEDTAKPRNKTTKRTSNNTNKKTSTNINQKEQNIPIYNKNVENDLSWIENIRYVREIEETEHDSNLIIEESFWDNYYLPGNWNENDFL